jgi:GH43 family beta-xylosidase
MKSPAPWLLAVLTLSACAQQPDAPPVVAPLPPAPPTTFTNPLLPSGPDPWVIRKDSFYYYTHTTGRNVSLWKTRRMSQVGSGTARVVWSPLATGPNSQNLWAPELHFLDGKWYVYYTAGSSPDLGTQRLFVLENPSSDPLQGAWTDRGRIFHPTEDYWAIDATVFEHRGKRYLLWSGYSSPTDITQRIYLCEMASPTTLTGPRVLLSSPEFAWETIGSGGGRPAVNEGPEILKKGGKIFLVYSGSGCWTDDYALGMLTLDETADPLDAKAWKKSPTPVFTKNPAGGAYGPGHNAFFQSPDGTEDWILYHANPQPGLECGDRRSPRMQKLSWNPDGTPNFGRPVAVGEVLKVPGGE